jgi:hypothetical protein
VDVWTLSANDLNRAKGVRLGRVPRLVGVKVRARNIGLVSKLLKHGAIALQWPVFAIGKHLRTASQAVYLVD